MPICRYLLETYLSFVTGKSVPFRCKPHLSISILWGSDHFLFLALRNPPQFRFILRIPHLDTSMKSPLGERGRSGQKAEFHFTPCRRGYKKCWALLSDKMPRTSRFCTHCPESYHNLPWQVVGEKHSRYISAVALSENS